MIAFALPWVLAGGALLALIVTALHLLAPRPPDRAPLPTARFLREDAHTTLRFRRRPSDVAVLATRVVLALLLGALFAGPRWVPDHRAGTTRVVLLDRGVGMAAVWDSARALARAEASTAGALIVPFDSDVGVPFAGSDAASLGILSTAAGESSYLIALRALRGAVARTATQEVEVVMVTQPRWSAWDVQLAGLRDLAWPGGIRLLVPGPSAPVAVPASAPSALEQTPPLAVVSGRRDVALLAALETLGYTAVVDSGSVFTPGADASGNRRASLRFISAEQDLTNALRQAALGDTVIVAGGDGGRTLPPEVAELWDPAGWPDHGVATSLQLGAARNIGAERIPLAGESFVPGRAVAPGAATLLPIVLEDGAPLASGSILGGGCLVRFGGPLSAGAGHPAHPELVRALADGCRGDSAPSLTSTSVASFALDSAAMAVLRGRGPAAVPVASVSVEAGVPMEGWLLLTTLLVATAESILVARMRRAAAGRVGPA